MIGGPAERSAPKLTSKQIGFVLGLALAVGLQLFPPPGDLSREGWVVASLAILMAVWWATEAIPIPATALVPLVVLPLSGALSMPDAAQPYASPTVMIYIGGFILALGLERWSLHERLALNVAARAAGRPRRLILGFMAATALISMWISNTAAALMVMPIAVSVADLETKEGAAGRPFAAALVLGVAYACSIGGIATPVGTPPNLVAIAYLDQTAGISVSFLQWMAVGVPVAAIFTPIAWLILTRFAFKVEAKAAGAGAAHVRERLGALGPLTAPEARIALVFGLVALCWILRQPALETLMAELTRAGADEAVIARARSLNGTNGDALIAIAGAIASFLIPAGGRSGQGRMLMDWETAQRLPWGVVLLFGGGLALADAIDATGLAAWLGGLLGGVSALPALLIILVVVVVVVFASELASNTAIVTVFMPVMGALALTGNMDLMTLVMSAALAGSYAFMMPVGTPPNAIAYGTGKVAMAEMIGAGFRLNLAAIVVVTIAVAVLVPLVLG
jgi:sodium-dependent dicarboxylate transporter 2/3/5